MTCESLSRLQAPLLTLLTPQTDTEVGTRSPTLSAPSYIPTQISQRLSNPWIFYGETTSLLIRSTWALGSMAGKALLITYAVLLIVTC